MKSSVIRTAIFLILTTALPILAAGENGITAFHNVRLIDGTGTPPKEHTTLLINGDSIEAVGQDISIPTGATIIEADGKSLMPALVLSHAHLGVVKGLSANAANITPDNVNRQLALYAKYGVGVVMSLGLDHDFIFTLRKTNTAPRIMTAGHGFSAVGGGPPPSLGDQIYRPTSPDEARKDVDELATKKVDLIKIWLDDFGGSSKRISPDIYKAIIAEAHAKGLRVAAHVYYLADAKAIVAAGVDILAHSIRDKEVDEELIAQMKQRGVWLIPTLDMIEVSFIYADKPAWMADPFFKDAAEPGVVEMLASTKYSPRNGERKVLKLAEANLKTLYDAGVKIGFGTDTGAAPIRVQGFGEHRELELMVQAGLTPLQAIQCATQASAKMLGLSKELGTLQPGKKADLILVDGDPSKNIRDTQKIAGVWLDGKKIQ